MARATDLQERYSALHRWDPRWTTEEHAQHSRAVADEVDALADAMTDLERHVAAPEKLVRVRPSNGKVVKGRRNDKVPSKGTIAGWQRIDQGNPPATGYGSFDQWTIPP